MFARTCRIGLLSLLALAPRAARSQAFNLTGFWRDNSGRVATYRMKQVDNLLYWMVDGSAVGGYTNMMVGIISGTSVTGYWIDMPGSPSYGSGTFNLRIDSNDRIVKVSQSANYAATIWTRVSSFAQPPQPTTPYPTPTPTPPPNPTPTPTPPNPTPTPTPPTTPFAGKTYTREVLWSERPQDDSIQGPRTWPIGTRVRMSCGAMPPNFPRYPVWGTDRYTTDSFTCFAAVHAGVIGFQGGTFILNVGGLWNAFTGSSRNGVESVDFHGFDRHISFER